MYVSFFFSVCLCVCVCVNPPSSEVGFYPTKETATKKGDAGLTCPTMERIELVICVAGNGPPRPQHG
jgi:hypothetical protein